MRAQFYCDSCDASVPFNAGKCPNCGKFFAAVKCPQCSYEGKPAEFSKGCPVCGYLSDELVGGKSKNGKPAGNVSKLSGRFVRIATIVLLVALAVLVVVLVGVGD
jgi:ssDNA-binding Zn-finger/Zn-ribbon topoisomerase 1